MNSDQAHGNIPPSPSGISCQSSVNSVSTAEKEDKLGYEIETSPKRFESPVSIKRVESKQNTGIHDAIMKVQLDEKDENLEDNQKGHHGEYEDVHDDGPQFSERLRRPSYSQRLSISSRRPSVGGSRQRRSSIVHQKLKDTYQGDLNNSPKSPEPSRFTSLETSARRLLNLQTETDVAPPSPHISSIDSFHKRDDEMNSAGAPPIRGLQRGLSSTAKKNKMWMQKKKYKDSNLDIYVDDDQKPKRDHRASVDYGSVSSEHGKEHGWASQGLLSIIICFIRTWKAAVKANCPSVPQLLIGLTIVASYIGSFKLGTFHSNVEHVQEENFSLKNEMLSMTSEMKEMKTLVRKLQLEISDIYETNENFEEKFESVQLSFDGRYMQGESNVNKRVLDLSYNETEDLDCIIYEVKGVKESEEEEPPTFYHCVDELHEGPPYLIEDLPEDMAKTVVSGETALVIGKQTITEDDSHGKVIHLQDTEPKLHSVDPTQHGRGRSLAAARTSGTRSLLMVRVTFLDNGTLLQPRTNEASLGQKIFSYTDVISRCSGEVLDIVPASGNNANNGVLTIKVNKNLSGLTWDVAETHVTAYLESLGIYSDTYDFVSYVMPSTVRFNGMAGLAYIGWYLSMFFDSYVENKFIFIHELAHNLGQDHSGLGDKVYGDKTGFLGQGDNYSTDVCFNGPKSWYFGWYADKQKSVDPSIEGFQGKMIGLDDYLSDEFIDSKADESLIVQITSKSQDDIYLMFNHNSGVTSGNKSIGNKLAVTTQKAERSKSWLLALLDSNSPEYRTANWNGSEYDLVIKVCSISLTSDPCNANVIAYIDSPALKLSCPSIVETPLQDEPVNDAPVCNENRWDKYVHKIKTKANGQKKIIRKSCNWLKRLKGNKPAKAQFFCNRKGRGGNPKASEICCETCDF